MQNWRAENLKYPRRYCLGLIEAGRPLLPAGSFRPAYPRRYCLGLIEARGIRPFTAAWLEVSEALLPRPH